MEPVISVLGLRKEFGSAKALDGIDLKVMPGRILGLIGPNGSGKTTLLKCILGLAPAEGQITVLGLNPRAQRNQLMEQVSFVADTAILPRWIKVNEALNYMAGVHARFDRKRAEEFLGRTGIRLETPVRQLSKGMVTQLHLALTMAIDSRLLVLDEPTLGLDILSRSQFYSALLEDYFDEDKTILLTTHHPEEIENLLTDVAFINKGKLCLESSMEDMADRFIELRVTTKNIAEARARLPIYSRPVLGGGVLIFEGGDRQQLSDLGEVVVPHLADVFIAKMHGAGSHA